MSIDHYENFPVASFLCPPALRPAITAIYHFARTADDLADEGDASPHERLEQLRAYRAALVECESGKPSDGPWQRIFRPLQVQMANHQLPGQLFHDLLSAFEQDLVKLRYADRAELLAYCKLSANPVGRLLLHLYRISDETSLVQSDRICSALQLANFWQDLSVDTRRGRLYVPLSDCDRTQVQADDLIAGRDSAAVRRLVQELVSWTRDEMRLGSPLVHAIPGRAGWELRLVVQGGLRILDRIEAIDHASLLRRPTLGWTDGLPMLWRALRMRRSRSPQLEQARP